MSETTTPLSPQSCSTHQPLSPTPPSPPSSSTRHPPSRPKSLRSFYDALAHSTTALDDILHDLDLSKEETEQLLALPNYHSHRQLRQRLLAQQLQLVAQDHTSPFHSHSSRAMQPSANGSSHFL